MLSSWTIIVKGVLVISLVLGLCIPAAGEDDSWRLPMAEKEKRIEENIRARHDILGLYPSQVIVPLDGSPVDGTTLGDGNTVHSVAWTSNYLAGASYRYAVLKRSGAPEAEVAAAKARADVLFEAVYRCQLVTGVKGFLARGYAIGHGETYEERWEGSKRNDWHQGVGEYSNLRWVGDPSHHIYSACAHALCQYYDFAAEGSMKERCREAMSALVSYWVDEDFLIHRYDRNRPGYSILGIIDGKTLDTRVMMAIAGAKEAYHVTGEEKFDAAYRKLTKQFGVRGLQTFICEKDFDDGEHVFGHLENLFRIEDDPELLAGYRVVADALWAQFDDTAQSLFTYIYLGFTPDAPNRDALLRDATFRLRTWPTDMTLRPTMNSLRKDLQHPYPTYLCAWDNEYIWKGHLLRLDGWTSRTVIQVAVPAEDPMVLYAIDEIGDLYQSRDGAATAAGWRPIDQGLRTPVRAIDAGHKIRMVFAACDDGFYISRSGGYRWERMGVPEDGGRPRSIQVDIENPYVIYAATDAGLYRSSDFGEDYLGKTWETLSDGLPTVGARSFHVATGSSGRIYAVVDAAVFTRSLEDDARWERGGNLGYRDVTTPFSWLAIDPADSTRAMAGVWTKFWGGRSLLRHTNDGGRHWSHDTGKWWMEEVSYEEQQAMIDALLPERLERLVICPAAPDRLLSPGGARGVLISTDEGRSWTGSTAGMAIPVAHSVMAPSNTDWLFAGTPAGLVVSKDGGTTWEDGRLCLQFIKNTRRELGGAAYIDAYWRARYYGFIDEAGAKRPYAGT
ncbi:MAG: hypothetical protein GWP08_12410 [Nitrospiraceae bacterium]|nr:hypothetical protein [Nitrospiraceae bacterium]